MLKKVFSVLLISALAFSCSNDEQSGSDKSSSEKESNSNLPYSVGASSEMLVVMNEGRWTGRAGEIVREFFHRNVPALPQQEQQFNTANINLNKLSQKMFKKHRNLFIVDIDDDYKEATISNKSDVWASPQRYVRINAPDVESFNQIFNKHKEGLAKLYHENEIRRVQETFKAGEDITLRRKLMRTWNFSVVLPAGFFIAKEKDNFLWIRKETQEYSQGLIVIMQEYEGPDQFDKSAIIDRRNKMTDKHIPGPSAGSYMKISTAVDVFTKDVTFNDGYAVETRGLWDVANDFMGGPFLSYTFVDEENNRLITLDSYVYAPGQDKRDKLLQMEAVMKTFELVDEEE
ncbi:MAG: DUF4837 family protein [Bacteroidota bacterium]